MTAGEAAYAETDEADDDVDVTTTPAAPFLRWVGSKRRYAPALAERCMANLRGRYIEPFLGSGSVALAMPSDVPMILGDRSLPLGYLWWWIQREPVAVAEYAAGYGLDLDTGWNTESGYNAARVEHNEQPYADDDYRPSARFLWLMSSCFNGIYRENKNGYFNVPWGRRKRASVPTVATLQAVATHLQHADIRPGWDFADVMAEAARGDVVFNDPPYDGDATAFTTYVAEAFTGVAQQRLRDESERAAHRGATVIMTNADTPRVRELYRGNWRFDEVIEARPVAANPRARMPARCLVVTSAWR